MDGALIAGSANLMNLFDLRPGRALKVSALTAGAMSLTTRRYDTEPAVVVGASLGLMRDDLAERAMLGDTGANALGAVLAVGAVQRWMPRARLAGLTTVAVATLTSERVSFTKVIADTPGLRHLDRARPPAAGTKSAMSTEADGGRPGRHDRRDRAPHRRPPCRSGLQRGC
ncbi:MAG: hypothetical protein R2704_06045 [Microthrixaceae bacterium]